MTFHRRLGCALTCQSLRDTMRNRQIALITILAFFATLSVAKAQSLGDVARTTRELRAKVTKERNVRTWTNDNLPKRPASQGLTAAAGMSAAPPSLLQPASMEQPSGSEASSSTGGSEENKQSPGVSEQQIKAARQKLANAEEQQRLAEDELSLLQIQQARELSPDVQSELESKIKAKTAEVEAKRAETAKAKKELEDLEKESYQSGAPGN